MEFLFLSFKRALHSATRLLRMSPFRAHGHTRCTFKTERGCARTGRNQDLACEIKVEAALIIDSEHVALRITQ